MKELYISLLPAVSLASLIFKILLGQTITHWAPIQWTYCAPAKHPQIQTKVLSLCIPLELEVASYPIIYIINFLY